MFESTDYDFSTSFHFRVVQGSLSNEAQKTKYSSYPSFSSSFFLDASRGFSRPNPEGGEGRGVAARATLTAALF